MDLLDLRYIVTVAKEKNISRAAERMFIAQPSLSQIIKRVETKVGSRLFTRTASGLSLTPGGEKFIRIATQMLDLKDELDHEMKNLASSESGQLTIGIPSFWGSCILPKILPEFHRRYPNIEIIIKELTSSRLEAMILKQEIDVAIMTLPILSENKIEYTPLLDEEVLIAVSSENELSEKGSEIEGSEYKILDPELLKDQTFILFPLEGRLRDVSNHLFARYKFYPQVVAHVVTVGLAKRLVLSNLGVTLMPRTFAETFCSPPDPVYFSLGEEALPKLRLSIAYKKSILLSNSTKNFIKIVTKYFKKE